MSVTTNRKRGFALHDIDFQLDGGQILGILGMNGVGKSTLLRALIGLESLDRGAIEIDGQPLDELAHDSRARILGYLPQHAQFRWTLPVEDAVALGLPGRFEKRWRWSDTLSSGERQALETALHEADIAHLRTRPVDELSGGERMRVHLARLFAGGHPVLAVDEPCASLDLHHQLAIMGLFQRKARAGVAVLMVLHDLALAQQYCDRLLVLSAGRLALDGSVAEVMSDPQLEQLLQVQFVRIEQDGRALYLAGP